MENDEYLGPTQVRLDRGEVVREPGDRGGVQFRTYGEPLSFYEKKGIITDKQKRAGEDFYKTWYYGCLRSPYVLMRWTELKAAKSDVNAVGFLWSEYRIAMLSIRTRERQRVIYRVCCESRYAGRGRILTLRDGLDDLMAHFKKAKNQSSDVENSPHEY